MLELDISTVKPSLSGPKRPHDRIDLKEMKAAFQHSLVASKSERGFALSEDQLSKQAAYGVNGTSVTMKHGALVIAAITSCTNTSNPYVMVGAGLVAKKAVERGLKVKPYVKTSLAPGSRVVTEYLSHAGLIEPLADLGFSLVGYGCTTCIGNSGPLPNEVVEAVTSQDLVASSVISGNRNFEGRVHPYSMANYLASPPLVVAYALAGTVDIDLTSEPLGEDKDGDPVYLKDIWPTQEEVNQTVQNNLSTEMFKTQYQDVFSGNQTWNNIPGSEGQIYSWDADSTYIQEPPFFVDLTPELEPITDINSARVLALLGDSITTDHISPAGAIPADSPAGAYLQERGITSKDFNSYGSRRGNDRVMTRGTFGNIRLKNQLVPGVEGSYTVYHPTGEQQFIYDAAEKFKQDGTPLIVIAGKEYGNGSSRDWAAKGSLLLGIKAVIFETIERIHRSNLVGMGVLPLQFKAGKNAQTLGLDGTETFDISGLSTNMAPNAELTVAATKASGETTTFQVITRLDTPIDIKVYHHGGILHKVLRERLQAS
jgi:aconitate hydratase